MRKILIVDDEKDLRDALASILHDEGFDTSQAVDGEEGLRKALTEHPNLILLDVVMPKLTGIEMLEQLRKDEWGSTADVLLFTVVEDPEIVSKAIALNTYDYLVKTDLSLNEIVAKVKEKLG